MTQLSAKLAALALAILCTAPAALSQDSLTLWYRQPAGLWVEALPVGNGHLGAMVFGGAAHERIQFNEQTVWTGEPHDYSHQGAYQSLGRIRELLFAGRQKEAEDLAMREFMSVPLRQKAYQAFGDLLLDFPEGDVSGYRRSLNLETGVCSIEYTQQGVTYRRDVFASYPAKAVVVRISASRPGSISLEAGLKSAHEGSTVAVLPTGDLSMTGRVKDSAIRFEARLVVRADGGQRESRDGKIAITGANSATLILSGATNFQNYKEIGRASCRERV